MMRFDSFSIKLHEAFVEVKSLAESKVHQQLEPTHL